MLSSLYAFTYKIRIPPTKKLLTVARDHRCPHAPISRAVRPISRNKSTYTSDRLCIGPGIPFHVKHSLLGQGIPSHVKHSLLGLGIPFSVEHSLLGSGAPV